MADAIIRPKKLDYNPDREGHAAHKFIVTPALKGMKDVSLGDETYKFGKSGAFLIKDEKRARELQNENHGRIAVTRVRRPGPADKGHKYFFGQMPAMPWHQYDENGKRIT